MNRGPINPSGRYVVYWMTSARRLGWNFGLQRAVDYAVDLKKPLVILEALRVDYPGANDRLHQFVLDGMAVNRRRAATKQGDLLPLRRTLARPRSKTARNARR